MNCRITQYLKYNLSYTATLIRVMNRNQLSDFEDQPQSTKEKHLKEITQLVCGLRLQNYTDRRIFKEDIFFSRTQKRLAEKNIYIY